MFRLLVASLAGTAVYVLVSFTCGTDGIWANEQLREQKRILSAQADEIQKINDSLVLEYTALEKDPDVIAGFAHRLGYVRSGETLVKINGIISRDEYHFETGTPKKYEEPNSLPEWFFVAYLYLVVKGFRPRNFVKKNKIKIKGIPVYDLPQV